MFCVTYFEAVSFEPSENAIYIHFKKITEPHTCGGYEARSNKRLNTIPNTWIFSANNE